MSSAAVATLASPTARPSQASQYLFWAIAAFTSALLAWAAIAKVDETATATGRVIPSRQLQIVSNLEGGVVKTILVKAGVTVTAGQPLLELDSTQFASEFGKTSETYNALVARVARLKGEVSGTEPVFPPALVAAAPQLVATERSLYSAQLAELAAASSVEQAKLDQAQRALGQAEVDSAMRAEGAALADREVTMIAPLVDKGIEPQIELLRAKTAQSQARGGANGAVLAIRRARSAVAEAQSGLRSVRNKQRAQAVEQLTQSSAELANQSEALPALQDRVRRTVLRAPISGTVNRVLVATVGGTVRPGEPLIEIVPKDDTLVVEADVKPADIAFMHPGQRATVKLTAYDYYVYGGLDAKVEGISPDATVNERSGESHFTIRVRTHDASLKAPDGSALPIGAGMTAQIDLLGHKRTILSYLLTPFSKLSDNAFREK
ncbi:HlyD family type I secretion periplasmic adaptor subunit [Sphingomonas sp. TREG-RG-20F-R18-01]|uniref:HlyD family type I secretion periplasmic adaptor subunit n=1 Tax=Sphingomonas sp. TREG-RG-20F-R18-01 TaxID=2914982 RepID=UPI001F58FA4F|nr:HlyD family type I secretion periplasmic adaptor subunit [Sphingomonas sp. TREG-RG-20F-R18-01]